MASSSTSSVNKSCKYDVFLSFRGEDTRENFVDHLYAALHQQGIQTYKDDERLEKGRRINHELLRSIENSKFSIVVFSKNYASSSWCLDELVKIMECHTKNEQNVYPVFYDVEPAQIRKQQGPVGIALAKHHNKVVGKWIEVMDCVLFVLSFFSSNKSFPGHRPLFQIKKWIEALKGPVGIALAKHHDKEIGKWIEALKEAGNLAGWDLKNTADGHEAKLIKMIVQKISLELRSINVYIDKKLVGMEGRVKKVLSSLETGIDDVRMMGICGIGGGGKTTLARTIFDEISTQFEGKCFVDNVSENSKGSSGLPSLQKQVLAEVLRDQSITVSSAHNGKSMMKMMLRGTKVLIVLDDVNDIEQLEALAGEPDWFEQGSRIIITTREKQVLKARGVAIIHGVDLLSDKEATCLLSRYAFKRDVPTQGYETLSRQVVDYAAGLPLVIRVLGGFLCGKDELEWSDQLDRLKTNPSKGTLDKLELSYTGLEDEDLKEMFLDVACFLKSLHKDDVVRVLESCGFKPIIGLRLLEEKSLITISDDQYVGMHDLIQEMGRNIVRRLHRDDPSRHSRLWIREEIEDILANDLGTDETRGIAVNDGDVELSSEIVIKGFGNMRNLRFLRVVSEREDDYSSWDEKNDHVTQTLPHSLRYLSWQFYPHSSLPKTFRANNLVALEMSECKIVQLWDGIEGKVLKKLRFLVLSHSKLRTLDLSLTPHLEKLDLEGCRDLVELHTHDGCLGKLVSLNLSGCSKIGSFSFIKQLKSLKVLSLTRLFLEEFPDIIPGDCNNSLQKLHFRHNHIEELPSSIGNLDKLVYLDLVSCRKLTSLPDSICGLQDLKNLKLNGCMLEELPEDIGRLKSLEKLNLSLARIIQLPDSICKLQKLKTLNLSYCWNLEKLPGDVGRLECLQKLNLTECTQVRDIPDSICRLKNLRHLSLLNCIQLEKLPKELGGPGSLAVLNVEGTRIRQLPQSISLLHGLKIN